VNIGRKGNGEIQLMEALMGSLPKLSHVSESAPPKIGSTSVASSSSMIPEVMEVIHMDVVKESQKCLQVREASVSGDTSKISGSDDRV
jgi:hypothetical protein